MMSHNNKLRVRRSDKFRLWLKVVLAVYVMVGAGLYFFQDRFMLHPVPLPADYKFSYSVPFDEMLVPYDNSTTFDVIRFRSTNDSMRRGAVIYCHGNMENMNHYAGFAGDFTKNGYDVWMMDYPSFGKSTGALNESILYAESLEVYKLTRAAGYPPDSIIIYGKSLGTGIAAQLASVRDCKRLILESPYYSVANVAAHYCWMYPVDWMLHYKIPTYQYLQRVTAPVTIFHGTEDDIIPFSNAEKLKPFLKPGDQLIPIAGGNHNNLIEFPLMKNQLDSLLKL